MHGSLPALIPRYSPAGCKTSRDFRVFDQVHCAQGARSCCRGVIVRHCCTGSRQFLTRQGARSARSQVAKVAQALPALQTHQLGYKSHIRWSEDSPTVYQLVDSYPVIASLPAAKNRQDLPRQSAGANSTDVRRHPCCVMRRCLPDTAGNQPRPSCTKSALKVAQSV